MMATGASAGSPGSYPPAAGTQQTAPPPAPVPLAGAPQTAGSKKRLSRKVLIGIIAGVLVLTLGIGGGVWLGTRQPSLDPSEIGNIFSPAILGVANNADGQFHSMTGDGQFTGNEFRAWLDGAGGNDCVGMARDQAAGISRIQEIKGSKSPQGASYSAVVKGIYGFEGGYGYGIAFDDPIDADSSRSIQASLKPCLSQLYRERNDKNGQYVITQESGDFRHGKWVSVSASDSDLNGGGERDVVVGCAVVAGNVMVLIGRGMTLDPSDGVPKASQIDCKSFAKAVADRIGQLT